MPRNADAIERSASLERLSYRLSVLAAGRSLQRSRTRADPRVLLPGLYRKAAFEDRRAHRDGAVKVQVVERIVTEIRAHRVEVPHPRSNCTKAVLVHSDAILAVIWMLTALVRDRSRKD